MFKLCNHTEALEKNLSEIRCIFVPSMFFPSLFFFAVEIAHFKVPDGSVNAK
jgi:hypothetical protein